MSHQDDWPPSLPAEYAGQFRVVYYDRDGSPVGFERFNNAAPNVARTLAILNLAELAEIYRTVADLRPDCWPKGDLARAQHEVRELIEDVKAGRASPAAADYHTERMILRAVRGFTLAWVHSRASELAKGGHDPAKLRHWVDIIIERQDELDVRGGALRLKQMIGDVTGQSDNHRIEEIKAELRERGCADLTVGVKGRPKGSMDNKQRKPRDDSPKGLSRQYEGS